MLNSALLPRNTSSNADHFVMPRRNRVYGCNVEQYNLTHFNPITIQSIMFAEIWVNTHFRSTVENEFSSCCAEIAMFACRTRKSTAAKAKTYNVVHIGSCSPCQTRKHAGADDPACHYDERRACTQNCDLHLVTAACSQQTHTHTQTALCRKCENCNDDGARGS